MGRSKDLDRSLASLSLGPTSDVNYCVPALKNVANNVGKDQSQDSRALPVIIMAMRKLREAIVATTRTDAFATHAYVFIIRTTVLEKHVESYHPALLHFLRRFHKSPKLSASEKHEIVGYYVLDLACRQGDLAGAFKAQHLYNFTDTSVELVLKAIVRGNWVAFWTVKRLMDERQQSLLELGEARMRKHAVNCLGRSYLSVDKIYVEKATGWQWKDLKEHEKLSWEQDNDRIMMKQYRRK